MDYTFSQVYNNWSQEHFRDIGKKGIEGYTIAYKHAEVLHNRKWRTLKYSDFQATIDLYANKSQSTRNKLKQLFGQMSQWAIREEITSNNFAPSLKLDSSAPKNEPRTFSTDEVALIRANADNPTAKILLILLGTGLRINELMQAERDGVHLEDNYIIAGEKTAAGRERTVPLLPEVKPLVKWLYSQPNQCRSYPGKPENTKLIRGYPGRRTADHFRKYDYYSFLDALNIPRRGLHATRRTFATEMASRGMKPEVLAAIMGHADYATTSKYYVDANRLDIVNAALNL